MFALMLSLALIGDSVTITGPGFTNHMGLSSAEYHDMKHRVGDSSVLNPEEIGAVYKTKHLQTGVDVLKDCFNHDAGAIYIGPKVDFARYFSVGIIGGTYVREHVETSIPHASIKHIDVLPLGGATASITVPVTKRVGVEVNNLFNYTDNHSNVGLKIGF